MFDNGIQRGFQDEDEGPFVAGAFQGEEPPDREDPPGLAGEYPEIYNEYSGGQSELYEGPPRPGRRHHHRRAVPAMPAAADMDGDAVSRESPFLDEEEMLQDLAGESLSGGEGRCACGRRVHGAPPRRRVVSPAHEGESDGGHPTLRRGASGQAVLDLQSSLGRLGFRPASPDGVFDAATDAAVRQFQQSRGLTADGIVGPMTWGEIDSALGGSPPSSGGGTGTTPGSGPTGPAPTGAAAAIVAEAQKHVGYREGPNNDNKFSAHFGVRNVAWCAYFVSYVHTMAGISLNIGGTDAMLDYLRRIGRFSTSSPAPGDIIIFDGNPADNDPSTHVGIVESVSDKVYTIEGNSSNAVSRRKYSLGDPTIVGYGRLWTSQGTSSVGSGAASGAGTGAGAAPLCANVRPSTTVNPYLREFMVAATRAGVPQSWASNAALIQLVGHESGWKVGVKAPSSTAFGLFQFLKSTWAKYLPEVPYGTASAAWQAVGGYRYIRAAYKTPERAWAFWQSTVCKNASLAPSDLQSRSRTWISKGYAGY